MPRPKRKCVGGIAYHVLNRANGRVRIFKKRSDFEAFERILAEGLKRTPMRLCGYCIMGNHWHMLLWPINDGDVEFMRWVTLTHTQRWHGAHGTAGIGHVYQGRFKSFPVQSNQHYLTVLRHGLVIDKGPAKLPVNWNRLINIDGTAKSRKHPPKPALAFSYQGYKELMTLASIFCRMRRLTQI